MPKDFVDCARAPNAVVRTIKPRPNLYMHICKAGPAGRWTHGEVKVVGAKPKQPSAPQKAPAFKPSAKPKAVAKPSAKPKVVPQKAPKAPKAVANPKKK